ncbi:expressed unknown protein [Seminavis robusta]|uniref:Uncharacterized protein n=1 Tax=Seminavis robusta TaxID=568900 RepID=A0A9N8EQ56_9STRA|nr:expressed unknown protein [Seminavis robusta]|eukprot:Sro1418_g271010.1 n/a (392) ;mRNA; f:21735-22910
MMKQDDNNPEDGQSQYQYGARRMICVVVGMVCFVCFSLVLDKVEWMVSITKIADSTSKKWDNATANETALSWNDSSTPATEIGSAASNRSSYFQSAVHVLQLGDPAYVKRFETHIESNLQLVDCMGYNYIFHNLSSAKELPDRQCMLTYKVGVIHDALHSIPKGDWLIWIDLDAQYVAPHCDDLERILPKVASNNHRQREECALIAMASGVTINTGIIIVRSTDSMLQFMEDFRFHQERYPICSAAGDQIAFQAIVMERAARSTGNSTFTLRNIYGNASEHDQLICPTPNRNFSPRAQRGYNGCFQKTMIDLGYSEENKRSFQDICLVGCTDRLQCADCQGKFGKYQRGRICEANKPVFFHHKQARLNLTPPVLSSEGHRSRWLRWWYELF